ncbi:MAG TPA: DUF167 domain-containing protein [Bryobacteraceae bacterium]|jgi:hypothetical protein|nr:DUF167 domain-containing protein [Bryobacteraceae bacterium]
MKTPKTRFTLKVRAGARQTAFAGKHGDAWKLNIAAPPVDGKANEAIVSFFAKLFGVRVGCIRIVTGHTGPLKIIEIEGIESAQAERVILESNGLSPDTGSAAARKT